MDVQLKEYKKLLGLQERVLSMHQQTEERVVGQRYS